MSPGGFYPCTTLSLSLSISLSLSLSISLSLSHSLTLSVSLTFSVLPPAGPACSGGPGRSPALPAGAAGKTSPDGSGASEGRSVTSHTELGEIN